ncbi:serine/threonine-protein kinase [Spirillospora albida]|uniref:serine/threonine-protein kinase n=1 Tax=Spirillospora albida TaxID=58123 RepID=UPI00068AC829|nr:serine/threonine-protein kinase [Spirillospora albida]
MEQARLLSGRYRLDSVVGRGGMGTVWRAYDVMLDREVAVKEVVFPPGLTDAERGVLYERTFREARASARLSHPGVVTVHDVVEEADRPWIVMELVLAPSLQDLLDRGPLEHRRVAEIGLQMLAALKHAHEKGILHRDVKPSNVLITDAGRVVLTDFGIAQVEGDATLTQTGLVMGSPAYIPPERAQGERAVPASDLWALGATLYAAVEGRSPYERSDAMSSLQAALTEPVPPPRNAGPLSRVLEGLLARQPVHRMTAAQVQPLLTQVATAPLPVARAAAETVLDEPSRMPGRRDGDPAETIMDPSDLDSITRPDRGDRHREQPRTLLENDWSVPPPQRNGTPEPQPSASPPWDRPPRQRFEQDQRFEQAQRYGHRYEQPGQYGSWQGSAGPRAHSGGERRKTVVVVTIAVLLIVAAVLLGAFILRQKLGTGALPAPEPRPVASAVANAQSGPMPSAEIAAPRA